MKEGYKLICVITIAIMWMTLTQYLSIHLRSYCNLPEEDISLLPDAGLEDLIGCMVETFDV